MFMIISLKKYYSNNICIANISKLNDDIEVLKGDIRHKGNVQSENNVRYK